MTKKISPLRINLFYTHNLGTIIFLDSRKEVAMTSLKKTCLLVWILSGIMSISPLWALTIDLVPDANLSGNQAALNAFRRAAAQWERWLSDPITVTINVGMQNLGSSTIIGQAGSTTLQSSYDNLAYAVYADSLDEPDDGIVAYLPNASAVSFNLPTGYTFTGNLTATKANLKALGYTGLDQMFGVADGTITFNTQFGFDYDNSDGVSGMDFESVASHEIGHILGFTSVVDTIDYYVNQGMSGAVNVNVLDLFRFNANNAPITATDFTIKPRELRPGQAAVFSDVINQYAMSTGAYTGDGRQASHWKDDLQLGYYVGIMDPTMNYNQITNITAADIRAMDLIGYEFVPEASSYLLLLLGILTLRFLRKRS